MKKLLLLVAILVTVAASAQDRVFTYTYQSGVLNKGQKEIEVLSTFLNGRDNYYKAQKHSIEFEVGLGSNLQTAFYLNQKSSTAVVVDANGVESVKSGSEFSFANEWKLKLSDPVANSLGSALYFEYTLAPTETELEAKIILDKQLGKVTNALNLVGEYKMEKAFEANGSKMDVEIEKELVLEAVYGLSYKIKNNFGLGFEVKNENIFVDSELESSVLLMGPVASYAINGFWINLTCMPQITDFKYDGLNLKGHERLQTRLIFSYVF